MHYCNWEEVEKYKDKIYDTKLFPNCIECSDGENWLVMKSLRNFFHKGNCGRAPFSGSSEPRLISMDEYFQRVSRRIERYKKYEHNMSGNIKCSCGEDAVGVRYEKFHRRDLLFDVSPSCGTHGIDDLENGREVGFIEGDPTMVQSEAQKYLNENMNME